MLGAKRGGHTVIFIKNSINSIYRNWCYFYGEDKNIKGEPRTGFALSWIGGDDENRTRVRKSLTRAFYEYSLWFNIPSAPRP